VEGTEETTTTYGDYTEYYVARGNSTNLICKATTDSAIDTTWGTNGYFIFSKDGTDSTYCYDLFQLDDGRLLAAVNGAVNLVMIDENGDLDTTWGTNGYYISALLTGYFSKILQDSDGNFHVFGGNSGRVYEKISSTGTYVTGLNGTNKECLSAYYDAVWADDDKTRIIAVGIYSQIGQIWEDYCLANITAIDPSVGTLDTTWTGNLTYAGCALLAGTGKNVGGIVKSSDDNFITQHTYTETTYYTLSKMLSDGSALDTSWGTSGQAKSGWPSSFHNNGHLALRIDEDDNIYTLTRKYVDGVQDSLTDVVKIFDSSGTQTSSLELSVGNDGDVYHCIRVIDDYIYFGTKGTDGANYDVEKWTSGLVYESGFDATGDSTVLVLEIIPDEITRTVTITTTGVGGQDESWGDIPTGYSQLEGETVNILADGIKQPQQVVTGGIIDETAFPLATYKIVGLPVTYKLMPMEMNYGDLAFILQKNIYELVLNLYRSLDGRYGALETDVDRINYVYGNYNASPTLFTGEVELPFKSQWDNKGDIIIWDDSPLPMTILSMAIRMDMEND
jgi:hypothetical protein